MATPNHLKPLYREINRHAYVLSQRNYQETRDALRATAMALLKQGSDMDEIIGRISKATAKQQIKI